jgi:hypothetical protein
VCTYFALDCIVPLIKDVISVKPNTLNADLNHILCSHCHKYSLNRGLLQKACNKTRIEVFGNPLLNAMYLMVFANKLHQYHVLNGVGK